MSIEESIPVPCPICKGLAVIQNKDDYVIPRYTRCKECDGYGYIRVKGCMLQ